ncbi:Crp/Fnr family transcriptional regulator [Magnetospirillum sp. J10]|uniref:Crp/Fnr family transcriptional regulator n=1 Tax=Magnetospirillum sulfuroxidans TaxID=611300 RepID=A0ABS5IB27_9PROT|nr:Crp/Fnr family transcriptional regulator [Magnetospirillum sulfuroxidans]
MTDVLTDALAILRRHPVFGTLPEDDLPALLDQPPWRSFAAGECLFCQNDPATRLYVVIDGQVELAVRRPDCAPEVLSHLSSGAALGVDALIPGTQHIATAQAATQCRAAIVDGAKLVAYLDGHFDLTLAMIAEMAGSLHGLVKEITELKLQSTTERLASYLAGLAAGHSADNRVEVRLPFEKRLLAERLGMEPATLSRAFAKLREIGVESGRGDRVAIADLAELRRLGEALEMLADGEMS